MSADRQPEPQPKHPLSWDLQDFSSNQRPFAKTAAVEQTYRENLRGERLIELRMDLHDDVQWGSLADNGSGSHGEWQNPIAVPLQRQC